MVGILRDHEQLIYDYVRDHQNIHNGVNNVARALKMQTNIVIEGYRNLTKRGLLTRHEGEKKYPYPYYTPNPDLIEDYLKFRKNSISFYQKIAYENLILLKRKKIFSKIKKEKTKQGGNLFLYTRNKKVQAPYSSFKQNLGTLISITGSIPFAQLLELIPKRPKYNKMIIEYQQEVLERVEKLIGQLCKDHNYQEEAIKNDLKWSLPVLEEIQRISFISRSIKK